MGRSVGSLNMYNDPEVIAICTKCNLPSKTCNKRCHHFEAELKRITEERRNENRRQRNTVQFQSEQTV